ncbi:MFS family permease [Allocatelliglobosispora scoriae]|uniref:MFS family permease n=1 Tax=Allocatelliglobosispora scoriae TaxID=643052 RepID=A0A841BNL8_9ACTN|nr:MFS family permease [Allocatelliglobosispora scoriae]
MGDYIAKVAVSALVFQQTNSAALAAAAFALTYLPWLVAGPLLATLAERYPYRNVMIICDLARMAMIGIVAIPGIPLPIMLVLLFLTALANPPAQAAKSALIPQVLTGDKLVVGLSLQLTAGQAAQVLGYLSGGLAAAYSLRGGLVFDAGTFALSALLLWRFVKLRPAANTERRNLIRETGDGFRLVFGTPALRAIAILVFSAMLFATLPEGLAAPWSSMLYPGEQQTQSFAQGLIMLANPLGYVAGGLIVGRLVPPTVRRRLIRPFAVAVPLALVPGLLEPELVGVCVMAFACGFAVAAMVPAASGFFAQVVPDGYRARAFGVMQMGLQLSQGAGIFVVGVLADQASLPRVVGWWSIFGVGLTLIAVALWPRRERFEDAVASVASRSGVPTHA